MGQLSMPALAEDDEEEAEAAEDAQTSSANHKATPVRPASPWHEPDTSAPTTAPWRVRWQRLRTGSHDEAVSSPSVVPRLYDGGGSGGGGGGGVPSAADRLATHVQTLARPRYLKAHPLRFLRALMHPSECMRGRQRNVHHRVEFPSAFRWGV